MSKKASFLSLFGLAANGKSEEEIRRIAQDAAVMMDEDTAPEHEPEGEPIPEEDAKPAAPAIDADALAKAIADAVIAALAPQKEQPEAEPEEEDKDPLDVALETIGKEIKGEDPAADEEPATEPGAEDEGIAEQEEAHVVPAEEMDEAEEEKAEDECATDAMDAQTAKSLILSLRPSIAAITDEAQRKAVTDALLSVVKRPAAVSDAAKIAQAAASNAAQKGKAPATDIEAIQALYDARNPHIKKGE